MSDISFDGINIDAEIVRKKLAEHDRVDFGDGTYDFRGHNSARMRAHDYRRVSGHRMHALIRIGNGDGNNFQARTLRELAVWANDLADKMTDADDRG